MKSKRVIGKAFSILLLLLLFLFSNGAVSSPVKGEPAGSSPRAGSLTTDADGVVPGGPGFISISSAAFKPLNDAFEYDTTFNTELYNSSMSLAARFGASVFLPNGVTVTRLVAYFYDMCGSNATVTLIKGSFDGFYYNTEMASVTSAGLNGYGNGIDETISSPVIDQQSNTYLVTINIPTCLTNLAFIGVRVDYSNSAFLPVIRK